MALGEQAERRRQAEHRSAVRRALAVEVAENLSAFHALFDDLFAGPGRLGPRPATVELAGALRLSNYPPLRFRRNVWGDQLAEAVDALTDDEQRAVQTYYQRLRRLETLRDGLGKPWQTIEHTYNFDSDDQRRWEAFRNTAVEIHRAGSPFPPDLMALAPSVKATPSTPKKVRSVIDRLLSR
jgi:hypothetical protein